MVKHPSLFGVAIQIKIAVLIPDHLQKTASCSSLPPAQLFAELNAEKGHKRVYIDGGSTIRQISSCGFD
jgi:hypothetical protein